MAKFAEKVKKRSLSCLQGHPVPAPACLLEKKPGKLLTPHSQGRKQPRNHGVSWQGSMRAHDFFKSPCLRTDGSRTSSAHHAESRKAEGAEYRRRNGSSKSQEPRLRTFSGVTMSVRNIFGHVAHAFPDSSGQTGGQQTGNGPGIPTIREKHDDSSPALPRTTLLRASPRPAGRKCPLKDMENCTCRCGFRQA